MNAVTEAQDSYIKLWAYYWGWLAVYDFLASAIVLTGQKYLVKESN